MNQFAWVLIFVSLAFQLLNIILVFDGIFKGERRSQIVLIPCIIWYVALVVREEPFFFESQVYEIVFVLSMHIFLTLALSILSRYFVNDHSAR